MTKSGTAKVLYDLSLHTAVHYCGALRVGGKVSIYVHDTLQFCIRVDLTHELHNIIELSLSSLRFLETYGQSLKIVKKKKKFTESS